MFGLQCFILYKPVIEVKLEQACATKRIIDIVKNFESQKVSVLTGILEAKHVSHTYVINQTSKNKSEEKSPRRKSGKDSVQRKKRKKKSRKKKDESKKEKKHRLCRPGKIHINIFFET
jgi:hypothetical protein